MSEQDGVTPEQPVNVAERRSLYQNSSNSESSSSSLLKRFSSLTSEEDKQPNKRVKMLSSEVEEIEEEENKKEKTGQKITSWSEKDFTTVFEPILEIAAQNGFEFDLLCKLAKSCKALAALFALSPKCSTAIIRRYVDAFMREKVTVRKFELDNTPTKESLEPFYHFEEERDGTGSEPGDWIRKTFTLTAPCVNCCLKDVEGIPNVLVSKEASQPWKNNVNVSSQFERVKTKNWAIRNPLVRLVAIYCQSHTGCSHANQVHEWLETVKQWPLAKQRKPWNELTAWHDHPPTLALPSFSQN